MQKVTSCARLHLTEYPTVLHLKCYKRQMKYFIRKRKSALVVGGINVAMQKWFCMIVQNGHYSFQEFFRDATAT